MPDYLEGFRVFGLSLLVVCGIAIVIVIIFKIKNGPHFTKKANSRYYHFDIEKLLEHIPELSDSEINAMGIDYTEIKNELRELFEKTVIFRETSNYDELKKVISDELFHRYEVEDKLKKFDNYKSITKFYIYEIKQEKNKFLINCIVLASPNDNELKSDLEKYEVLKISYTKSNNTEQTKCPNCGSELDGDICPYCRSSINIESSNLILVDEEILDSSTTINLEEL